MARSKKVAYHIAVVSTQYETVPVYVSKKEALDVIKELLEKVDNRNIIMFRVRKWEKVNTT